jgi:hypothetical protein
MALMIGAGRIHGQGDVPSDRPTGTRGGWRLPPQKSSQSNRGIGEAVAAAGEVVVAAAMVVVTPAELETRRSPGQGWIPAPRFIAKNGSGTEAPDGYGAALTGHAAPTPNGQGEPSRGSRGQTSASRSPIIR